MVRKLKITFQSYENIVIYSSDVEGVAYTVEDEDGEVMHITYQVTAKDCKKLARHARTNKRKQ